MAGGSGSVVQAGAFDAGYGSLMEIYKTKFPQAPTVGLEIQKAGFPQMLESEADSQLEQRRSCWTSPWEGREKHLCLRIERSQRAKEDSYRKILIGS